MTRESMEWLNQNTLIGMTDKRGLAWHHRASAQGTEPNHYPGAIPIADVRRRLFAWSAEGVPVFVPTRNGEFVSIPNRQAIVRNDTWEVLGVHSGAYVPHQYYDSLLSYVQDVLDDSDLIIGSAGLLKSGAIGWVQIELPENRIAGDVEFRPNLLATTSFNGSIATTYKRTATIVVCDNTREMALRESGANFRIRHTRNSQGRLAVARETLGIVNHFADEFQREVEEMLAITVGPSAFDRFMDLFLPTPPEASQHLVTRTDNTRDRMYEMWNSDARVAPWKGTGFGVIQLVNTYNQHERQARAKTIRVERTMLDTLSGANAAFDHRAARLLVAAV